MKLPTETTCSSFAATGEATADHTTLVAMNNMWYACLEQNSTMNVLHVKSPGIIGVHVAGWVGRPGTNSKFGLAADGLQPSDADGSGVPYPFICRKALEQRNIADAIDAIVEPKRGHGMHYTLADNEGEAYSIEVTAKDHEIVTAATVGGYVATANLYVTPRLKPLETSKGAGVDWNEWRRSRISQILGERCGKITVEDFMEIHRDHGNYPNSVCSHAIPPDGEIETITTFVAQPAKSRIWITKGPACENQFIKYEL